MANLIERALQQDIEDNNDNDEDDRFQNFENEDDVISEVQDLLMIEIDPVAFGQGDFKNIKK